MKTNCRILASLVLVANCCCIRTGGESNPKPWHFEQIIDTAGQHSRRATISADGSLVVFDSRADVRPMAPGSTEENIELFSYHIESKTIEQMTATVEPDSRRASVSRDGLLVALESTADLAPGKPGNVDGSLEIFLFDATKKKFLQLTASDSAQSLRAAISLDGTRVAFASTSSHPLWRGAGKRPGRSSSHETKRGKIFLVDLATREGTRVTAEGFGHSRRPAIDEDGSHVAFDADAELPIAELESDAFEGPGVGNSEIFLFTETGGLAQITRSDRGESQFASLSAEGGLLAFQSSADLVPSGPGNSDGNFEIFVFDVAMSAITQVTATPRGDSLSPWLSANGEWLAFYSNADPVERNADRNFEVFVYDVTRAVIHQVTDTMTGDSRRPRLTHDGRIIVFDSSSDLVGRNMDLNQEIFVARVPRRSESLDSKSL